MQTRCSKQLGLSFLAYFAFCGLRAHVHTSYCHYQPFGGLAPRKSVLWDLLFGQRFFMKKMHCMLETKSEGRSHVQARGGDLSSCLIRAVVQSSAFTPAERATLVDVPLSCATKGLIFGTLPRNGQDIVLLTRSIVNNDEYILPRKIFLTSSSTVECWIVISPFQKTAGVCRSRSALNPK